MVTGTRALVNSATFSSLRILFKKINHFLTTPKSKNKIISEVSNNFLAFCTESDPSVPSLISEAPQTSCLSNFLLL